MVGVYRNRDQPDTTLSCTHALFHGSLSFLPSLPPSPALSLLRYHRHVGYCGFSFESNDFFVVGANTNGRNHLLTKHRGIAQRLLVEQQAHCASLASACCAKFQSVLAWLQRKPKDIEEVYTQCVYQAFFFLSHFCCAVYIYFSKFQVSNCCAFFFLSLKFFHYGRVSYHHMAFICIDFSTPICVMLLSS